MLSEWSVGQGRSLMPCLDAVSEAHPEDRSRRAGRDCSSRSCGVGRWSRRLARKLRAPSGTVSGQSLQKPRARFPPGSRCGLCVARVLHHSRVSYRFLICASSVKKLAPDRTPLLFLAHKVCNRVGRRVWPWAVPQPGLTALAANTLPGKKTCLDSSPRPPSKYNTSG